MERNGLIIGKFGHGGKLPNEFMAVHGIDCRNENEIYVGEISNWRVQKLSLHPNVKSAEEISAAMPFALGPRCDWLASTSRRIGQDSVRLGNQRYRSAHENPICYNFVIMVDPFQLS